MSEGGEVVIKKVKKGGHGGHHGGAWKVAYADFVTAMMAFFLLLWLLNSVTQEQLEGISNYFAPITASQSTSGAGDILGGKTIAEEGASTTDTSRPSVTMDLPPPKAGSGGSGEAGSDAGTGEAEMSPTEQQEEEKLQDASREMKQNILENPNLVEVADNIQVDVTPEGLRIQIVDKDGKEMFVAGSSRPTTKLREALSVVAQVLSAYDQHLKIEGHTDASGNSNSAERGNWELSADRANASRRLLVAHGFRGTRVDEVVGRAAREPLFRDDPNNIQNRRISITLLRGTGDKDDSTLTKSEDGVIRETLPGLFGIRQEQVLEDIGEDDEGEPRIVGPGERE